MANAIYDHTRKMLIDGDLNLETDDIRALLTKTMSAATTADTSVTEVVAGSQEIAGSGYAREVGDNPETVLSTVIAYVNDTVDFAFGTIVAGETITGCLIYKFVTDDDGSLPLVWLDLTDTATTGQPVSVALGAEGWLKLA